MENSADDVLNDLTWLMAAGVGVHFSVVTRDGAATSRVALTDLDEEPEWFGFIDQALKLAIAWCQERGIEP